MGLNIKDPEAERLIREVAAARGKGLTETVREVFADVLAEIEAAREIDAADVRASVRAVVKEFQALPVIGPDLTDDDLYDEQGLPK